MENAYLIYKTVFESLPVAACIIDSRELKILNANSFLVSSITVGDVDIFIGLESSVLVSSAHCSDFKTLLSSVNINTPNVVFESTILSNGSVRNIVWKISLVDPTTLLLIGEISELSTPLPILPAIVSVAELPYSKLELSELFQKAPIGIHSTSGGRILWANDFLLNFLGYSADEYIGHETSKFVFDPESLSIFSQRIVSGESVTNVRMRMKAKNGVEKHIMFDSKPFFKADGSFSHTASFIRDDLDQILTEAAMQEEIENYSKITKEKDRFIRIMFHEIRTPLHILSNNTVSLNNTMNAGKMPISETAAIVTQVDKCLGLVEDLSFAMMFEADKVIAPHPDTFNIREVVESTLGQLHIQYDNNSTVFTKQVNRDFSFKLVIEESVPHCISVDKALIRVFYNLLLNASKYCTPKGQVVMIVTYVAKKAELLYAIEDERTEDHCPNTNTTSSGSAATSGTETQSTGVLSVSVTNTVAKPLNLVYINKLFQQYLHAHSAAAVSMNKDVTGQSNSYSPTVSCDRINLTAVGAITSPTSHTAAGSSTNTAQNSPRVHSHIASNSGESPHTNIHKLSRKTAQNSESVLRDLADTLVSKDGLGLGLYVSYNILQSLGGLLECSTTATEACFSFTLPVVTVNVKAPEIALLSPGREKTKKKYTHESWSNVTNSAMGSKHVVTLRNKVTEAGAVDVLSSDTSIPGTITKSASGIMGSKSEMSSSIRNNSLRGGGRRMPRVLVVDDSPICRKVLIKSLEQNGYATDYACDGQEACEKLSHEPCTFDAVLMDLRMPIMDGLTATRLCKQKPHLTALPIIIVTAEVGEDVRCAAMEAKASCFISKPAKLNELLNVLQSEIGGI